MFNSNDYFILILSCLQTIYNCIVAVIGQYIYGYFLKNYPDKSVNWTVITNSSLYIEMFYSNREQCIENTTDTSNNSVETWAQQQSADLIFKMTLWRAFPVIIVTYFFGLYASRLNRQLVLIFSIIGNSMHVLIYQAIIYENLPEYWWYAAACIAGLAGGTNIIGYYKYHKTNLITNIFILNLGIIVNLVITECTEENDRSSRFVRLNAITTALSAISAFGIGYYIQWRGFTDLFWAAIGVEFLSILVVIIFLKPTNIVEPVNETTALLSSSNDVNVSFKTSTMSKFYRCFDICTVVCLPHQPKMKSISLVLILVSYIFHNLVLTAMSPLLWYLLGAPFCWTSKDLGEFSAVSLISMAIFSVLGMKLLNSIGANDAIICSLSHICFLAYALWISFAQYSWQLYLSLLINPFSGYQNTLTVPMISKLLGPQECSNIVTLITEINTIILAFGNSLFNWVYARTVVYQNNFTFLVASGLCLIPAILNL